MPTLPRRDGSLVPTAPLPDVRLSPAAPAAAFGVPRGPDLSGLQRNVTEIVDRERQHADQVAVLDADNQLAALQDSLLYAQGSGALTRKGKDAFGVVEQVGDGWTKGVAAIQGKLTTDRQQEAFTRLASDRWQQTHQTVQRYVAGEMDAYDRATTDAARQNRTTAALDQYHDPAAVAGAIDQVRAINTDFARRNGWSAEQLADRNADDVTRIHAAVIDRLVANRQDLAAVDYLTAHRGEMSGENLVQAESLVSKGSVLGAAQRSADGIVQTAPSLDAALGEAAKILDPQVRDETEQRLRRTFEDRGLAAREQQLAQEVQAGAIVRKTGRFDAIPTKLLDGMTPIQVRDLKLLEESLRRRPSDPETVIRLRNLSAFDRDAFARLDLGQYRDQLSDADLKALQSTQRTLLTTAATRAAATRTRQQKDLRKAQQTAGFYAGQHLEVPAATQQQIKALQDSLGTTPHAPGAPLPTVPTAAATPPGAVAPLVLPGAKPPDDDEDEDASDRYAPTVPAEWLAHAEANPDYAAYLEQMGVTR